MSTSIAGSASGDPGVTIPVSKLSELAHAWWNTRLQQEWRPRDRPESQAILASLGLVDPFWTLP